MTQKEVVFLSKNLDDSYPTAIAQLTYEANHYNDIVSVTANFGSTGNVTITRMTNDKKPRSFSLTKAELDTLIAANEQFHAEVEAARKAEEDRLADLKKEAFDLAASLKFDLADLNIKIEQNGEYYTVSIPAVGFKQTCFYTDLLDTVQLALDCLQRDVEYAEKHQWCESHPWGDIRSAYRKVKPLPGQPEQGESLPTSSEITIDTDVYTI